MIQLSIGWCVTIVRAGVHLVTREHIDAGNLLTEYGYASAKPRIVEAVDIDPTAGIYDRLTLMLSTWGDRNS